MKHTIYLRNAVVALILCLLAVAGSQAAVLTIDPATKSGTSDLPALEVKAVRVADDQVGFYVRNLTEVPQKFAVRVNGLSEQDYDIYINGEFKGTKPARVLREGMSMDLPGAITDPDMMRCLRALKPKVEPEYDRMRNDKQPEVMRVAFMFNQVVDFVNSGIRNDQSYRSATVIAAPSGKAIRQMVFMTRLDAETTAMGITRACWLIQKARHTISHAIKDPELRNSSLLTITPVELSVKYTTVSNKPHAEVSLTNNCNLPVSGAFSMALPKGWKNTAKNLTYVDLKPGKTQKVAFDLVPPTKGATPPAALPVAATIIVVQETFSADMKLKTTAAL